MGGLYTMYKTLINVCIVYIYNFISIFYLSNVLQKYWAEIHLNALSLVGS